MEILKNKKAVIFDLDGTIVDTRRANCLAYVETLREAGYAVRPTCANFFLVETPDDEDFIRFMLERGIVVRHTRNFAGLDGKFVRIAARTKDEDDLLIEAAREYARARGTK